MIDVLLNLVILGVSLGLGVVVHLARERRLRPRTVRALAAVCGLALVAMIMTDWPAEVLADFWADHSILAGILSTVLLVGVVFLVFEDAEQREQDTLDNGLTAAGLGGIVDHVVDAEVALALLSRPGPPAEPGWQAWDGVGKPLRWLRNERHRLHRNGFRPGPNDPRSAPVGLSESEAAGWRAALVDQCVRRLLAAIRDWSPVIGVSKNGVQALLAISEVRKDLMELSTLLEHGHTDRACALTLSLRQRLRVLAHFFESQSGADPCRDEVLLSFEPLPRPQSSVDWAADASGRDLFRGDWQKELRRSEQALAAGGDRVG